MSDPSAPPLPMHILLEVLEPSARFRHRACEAALFQHAF